MKGLHNIRLPAPKWTWRWYGAHQSRLGRRHLLRVPLTEVNLTAFLEDTTTRRRVPYHLRYASSGERADWAARMERENRNTVVPHNVNLDEEPVAERYCDMEQAAIYYEQVSQPMVNHPDAARPRGFCDICWRAWVATDSVYRASYVETRQARQIGYLRADKEGWETSARRDYRPS